MIFRGKGGGYSSRRQSLKEGTILKLPMGGDHNNFREGIRLI